MNASSDIVMMAKCILSNKVVMEGIGCGNVQHWHPNIYLMGSPSSCHSNSDAIDSPKADSSSSGTHAIVVLNGEQHQDIEVFKKAWNTAILRVAVDGGTNFIFDKLGKENQALPHLITGDFDSCRSDVADFFKSKGVSFHHTPNQDETDFFKCLQIVDAELKSKNMQVDRILVFGAFGHRLDHMFSNVNALIKVKAFTPSPIYLIGNHQQAFLLDSGEHHIYISDLEVIKWCGLVPVSEPVVSKTTGLKWNLDGETMEYGALISTSNEVIENHITINCDGRLLWMMGD
ncbi:TPK1 [Bugula neritina]|uniref:TPK1 n=1 Tax=Bugula neritina TaxID=10212 RepID=A0A7J7K2X1_BUGNE|nr:TPK1 [Bugula neritina]